MAEAKPSLEGRLIGCLVGDGTDEALLTSLRAAATKAGAKLKLVALTADATRMLASQPTAVSFVQDMYHPGAACHGGPGV